MEIRNLLKRFAGMPISFEDLYYLAKNKRLYNNKVDFEIALENAMDDNLVGCVVIQNENRFYSK